MRHLGLGVGHDPEQCRTQQEVDTELGADDGNDDDTEEMDEDDLNVDDSDNESEGEVIASGSDNDSDAGSDDGCDSDDLGYASF